MKEKIPTWSASMLSQIRRIRFEWKARQIFHFFLIGVIAGLGSILFHYLCEMGTFVFMGLMAGYQPPTPAGETHLFAPGNVPYRRWMLLFLPAVFDL